MTASTHTPVPQIRLYQDWLAQQHGLRFNSYEDLHHWSVSHLADFWRSIWDYYQLQSPTPLAKDTQVLSNDTMPNTQWFCGVQVSLPRQLLRAGVLVAVAAGTYVLGKLWAFRAAGR